jgi:hypothetical protein
MKHFMIKYQFANGTPEQWHQEVTRFISALDNDPNLKGKILYRVMKNRDDSSYYHLATAADERAIKTLQSRDFFKHYTEKTRQVAGGEVVVTPIELIADSAALAFDVSSSSPKPSRARAVTDCRGRTAW